MSLLTRCPACETLYKLVPDQLRISQGWVKCGQCSEIFDASKHLIQVAVEPAAAAAPALLSVEPEAVAADSITLQGDLPAAALTPVPISAASTAAIAVVMPQAADETNDEQPAQIMAEAPSSTEANVPAEPAELAQTAVELRAETPGSSAPVGLDLQTPASCDVYEVTPANPECQKEPLVVEQQTDEIPALGQSPLPEAVPQLPKVSFLGDSQRRSVWHSRIGKVVLWLALLLLGVGAGLQWLYWERDRLAAAYPDFKPLLQQMCQPLNCSIQTLQRIDALAIDSATFNRLDSGSYRLSFVIKNLSNLALALPSVELTLTDTQEQVMVRRALLAQDLFAHTPALLPGAELPVSLLLGLDLGDAAAPVMGYRLLAFYP